MVVAAELEAVRVAHQRAGLDAQQRVVGDGVLAVGVVAVVGGEQRGADAAGDLEQLRVGAVLLGDAVVLDLDEEVVPPEDVLEPAGLLERPLLVAPHQRLEHVAAEAAGGGDDALAVLLEEVPVEAGLVVVALEEGPAGELDEVAVADVALGQQREVVVELLAASGVAAGVVHATPPAGPLEPAVVGHVGLGAQDRLDPVLLARLVERQDPVHVAVVGDADRRLAVGRGRRHDVVDTCGAVEHRVLGVHVEVGEGVAQRCLPRSGSGSVAPSGSGGERRRPRVHWDGARSRPDTGSGERSLRGRSTAGPQTLSTVCG